MRPPLIQRPRRSAPHRTRERGVTMALVALAIVGVIAMAGLSIDVGTLYQASAEAQRAADAAALAAARTISMQGLTGDPTNASASWQQICGGASSPASLAAITVVGQNPISSASSNPTVTVNYLYAGAGSSTDCSTLSSTGFGVNPQVTVLVQQSNLPTYFSRIWGRTGNTIGASATAEVFNPSNSGTYAGGTVVPVQPRCVKPWIVPNYDPFGGTCTNTTTGCFPLVTTANGSIGRPGISVDGGGVIGERFWLVPDCAPGATCMLLGPPPPPSQPQANYPGAIEPGPNLEYIPGQASFSSIAIPSDGSSACTTVAGAGDYAQAIAGCDQSTQYQCGVQGANNVDLSENPGSGDTTNGVQCLTHQSTTSTTILSGQDALLPTGGPTGAQPPNYPFQIQVGAGNPLLNAVPNPVPNGGVISSSNSIMSLPIYDSANNLIAGAGTTPVTIVGFLQVFVNVVDSTGNLYVTVLNVSGCGNAVTGGTAYLNGTSPVPVRLITPQ